MPKELQMPFVMYVLLMSSAIMIVMLSGCINTNKVTNNVITNNTNMTNVTLDNESKNNPPSNSSSLQITPTTPTSPKACLQNHGVNKDIIFIYADWCPHCAKMKPWVQQLTEFDVYWAPASDSSVVGMLKECLSGVAELKYIPEFVCVKNGRDKVGEFYSIDEMKEFFKNCQ